MSEVVVLTTQHPFRTKVSTLYELYTYACMEVNKKAVKEYYFLQGGDRGHPTRNYKRYTPQSSQQLIIMSPPSLYITKQNTLDFFF